MENIRKPIKKAVQRLRSGTGAPDFWAFVRKLENADTVKPRLGYAKNSSDENIRFGQVPFLHFPTAEIAEIIEGGRQAGVDATMIVYFFGLLGINGPMPREFTNYVFRRSHNYFDNTWRRFLDIIHHRFLSLYYRAFSCRQQAMSFDRPEDDPIRDIIKSLAGFQEQPEAQEGVILSSARHFSFPVKNRWGLEDVLRKTFKMNLEVRDFILASYDIPPNHYAILGKRQHSILGASLQIGRTYMSVTGKFEVHIGPLSFENYRAFMSDEKGFTFLIDIIVLYLDRPLDFSVVFSLLPYTIPLAQLGFDPKTRWETPQLGISCWVGSLDDPVVNLSIAAGSLKRGRHTIKKDAVWQS